jgi:hypothetical protein
MEDQREFGKEVARRRELRAEKEAREKARKEEERARIVAKRKAERERKLERARRAKAAMEENPDAFRKGKWPRCTQ